MATKTPSAPKTAAPFADVVLPDDEGTETRLGDLWAEGPAVVVWIRHYG
jgi:hypothetical protein